MTDTTPIYRLSPRERPAAIAPFVGRWVIVYVDLQRDGMVREGYRGKLITTAWLDSGTTNGIAVIDEDDGKIPIAVSLATVAGVAPIGGGLSIEPVGRLPRGA